MRTLLSVILLASTGCKTTPGAAVFDPVKASNVINITVPSAVRLGVSKEPRATPYLTAVAEAIEVFSKGKVFDVEEFQKLLDDTALGIDALKTPEARAVLDTLSALYTAYYADVVQQKLDKASLIPVLQAISNSIRKGLH